MTDYDHHATVPIVGMYGDDGPIVELGVIQTVPEGKIVLDDEPTAREPYDRKARQSLTPDEAREVAAALEEMAQRVEEGMGR